MEKKICITISYMVTVEDNGCKDCEYFVEVFHNDITPAASHADEVEHKCKIINIECANVETFEEKESNYEY